MFLSESVRRKIGCYASRCAGICHRLRSYYCPVLTLYSTVVFEFERMTRLQARRSATAVPEALPFLETSSKHPKRSRKAAPLPSLPHRSMARTQISELRPPPTHAGLAHCLPHITLPCSPVEHWQLPLPQFLCFGVFPLLPIPSVLCYLSSILPLELLVPLYHSVVM